MRHHPKNVPTLSIIPPAKKTINGTVYISFRDIVRNLIVQAMQQQGESQQSFSEFNEKIREKAVKPLSPRHRKRLLKQAKKLGSV